MIGLGQNMTVQKKFVTESLLKNATQFHQIFSSINHVFFPACLATAFFAFYNLIVVILTNSL